jgi:hypothetical protein
MPLFFKQDLEELAHAQFVINNENGRHFYLLDICDNPGSSCKVFIVSLSVKQQQQ